MRFEVIRARFDITLDEVTTSGARDSVLIVDDMDQASVRALLTLLWDADHRVTCSAAMPAPPVLRDVFNDYRARWGEEDDGFLFEDEHGPISRLEVLVYRPANATDVTAFATIGMAGQEMSAAPGPGGGGRAELHLRRRGELARIQERNIALRLANLAVHPFRTEAQLNWGHLIGFGEDFPTFPGCQAVFLSGPLSAGGLDYVRTSVDDVRIINVVPITEAERELGRTLPPVDFAHSLLEHVDVFAERPQPS
jgi:hypothetical protein